MSEKLDISGSKFPENINQMKLNILLEKANNVWYGIKDRSDFIKDSIKKAKDIKEGVQSMKEIEDILNDIRSLIVLSKELEIEYKKVSVRLNEDKQDKLAEIYSTKLYKAIDAIREEKGILINFANIFRDIELNEILNVPDNIQRRKIILKFSNPELDKKKKEFIQNAKGIEVDLRVIFFEETIMDSMLRNLGSELQALSRLEAMDALTPNPLDNIRAFSYYERIFRQLIAQKDIVNAEKVLKKMNNDRFYDIRNGYRFNYSLMLQKVKDDDIYGKASNN